MSRFIEVYVEEHEEIPAGCCLRFRAIGASTPVRKVRYTPEGGEASIFLVEGAGSTHQALSVEVEDSGAGFATLIYGGDKGLRLSPEAGGPTIAESYLLLAREEIIE